MKKIFLSAVIASSLFACNPKDSLQTPTTQEIKSVVEASEKKTFDVRHYNSFLNEIGLNDLVFAENYKKPIATWQDYDKFYMKFIKNEKYQKHEYFEKVKQSCYFYLVNAGNLHKDNSVEAKEKVKYYLAEMSNTTFIHPIWAMNLLNASDLSTSQKKSFAKNAVAKSNAEYEEDILVITNTTPTTDKQGLAFLADYKSSVNILLKLQN